MFSKKLLRPSFDDEKHDSGPFLKKKKVDNYNKFEIVNENGDNMDGSKVRSRDLVTIRINIRYYKTFIDQKKKSWYFIVITRCKAIDARSKHARKKGLTTRCFEGVVGNCWNT